MLTKKLQKLCQASEAANDRDTQHILLSIPADGKVSAAGSDSLVTGMVSDVDFYKKIKDCIKSHVTEEAVGLWLILHAGWKELGTCVIRGILKDMLSEAAFGRGKEAMKLQVGLSVIFCFGVYPPFKLAGCRQSNFKGSTSSGLNIAAVTDILISMLQAAGINPETHVQPAVDSFLQDKDPGNIEEEDPENNVKTDEVGMGLDIDTEKDLKELLF